PVPAPRSAGLCSSRDRPLTVDGRVVRKLSEVLGVFRAVVFCSEDIQLVKGPASRRRRYHDLLLSQTHPGYLALLQGYTRAVRSRNALLRQRGAEAKALDAFTRQVVSLGEKVMTPRREILPIITPLACEAYGRVT